MAGEVYIVKTPRVTLDIFVARPLTVTSPVTLIPKELRAVVVSYTQLVSIRYLLVVWKQEEIGRERCKKGNDSCLMQSEAKTRRRLGGENITMVPIVLILIFGLPLIPLVATMDYTTLYSRPLEDSNLTDLHLIALIPMTGDVWPGGPSQLPLMEWALKQVGEHTDMLEGYRMVVHVMDTQVGAFSCIHISVSGIHAVDTQVGAFSCIQCTY